jgi:acetyltransferase-like isoleucine patch superfamily enzyme
MLSLLGYRGSHEVHLHADARVMNPEGLMMDRWVTLSRDTSIECRSLEGSTRIGRITLGEHVFVGERTSIVSHENIEVGPMTMISHNCSIMDFNHGTSPGEPMSRQPGQTAEVRIGRDCWLGAGVIVLPGVTIGDGTIVGAGAVVTRSLPPNVLAAGVPARVVRPR